MEQFVSMVGDTLLNGGPASVIAVGTAGMATALFFMGAYRGGHDNRLQYPKEVDKDHQSVIVQGEDNVRKSKIWESKDPKDCMTFLFDDCRTMFDVIPRGTRVSKDGQCLGHIVNGKYEWITYQEIGDRMANWGSGLLAMGISAGQSSKIGIYATNCVEYVIIEYGSYGHNMVLVPLYDTLGTSAVSFIMNDGGIEVAICDTEDRFKALIYQSDKMIKLKHIILINDVVESLKAKAAGYGINVKTMKQVEQMGRDAPAQMTKPRLNDLAVICYTSGTTGSPKGVMLSHENIVANYCSVMAQLAPHAPCGSDTYLSFLPLAHMFERCCQAAMLTVGGKIGFYSGNIKTLSDDMKLLRPTVIPCVPRICNRIYNKTFATASTSRMKSWLLKKALASKKAELDKGIVRNNGFWDKLVFKKVSQSMGGRMRLIVVGAAPLDPDVLTFMRSAIGCLVVEGYGQTESVCPVTMTFSSETGVGHVGPPIPSAWIKLIDVPEMEYYSSENKGEICIKGSTVFQGYYNDPRRTKEAFDHDGWLMTGDIGTWLPNGCLKIIDRKKHIFKLSQGEYIAPEKIENVYSRSPFVAQVFVHGDSLKSTLIGIVVPEPDILLVWGRNHNIRGSVADLCKDPRCKQAVFDDLIQIGKKDGLKPFEQVGDIMLHPDLFSVENNLLTPTLKTKRPEVRKFFAHQLDQMYDKMH